MKFTSVFNDFSTNDFYLLGLFVVYLVIPFHTPSFIYNFLVHPVGLIFLLCTAVYMFFSVPHILAILYVLVIYELLRRDGNDSTTYRESKQANEMRTQSYKYATDPAFVESVDSRASATNELKMQKHIEDSESRPEHYSSSESLEENMIMLMSPLEYASGGSGDDFRPIDENKMGGSAF
jgi:hypothetical protein